MFESEKQSGINCRNKMCRFQGDDRYEQLCCGVTEHGSPSIEDCESFLPEQLVQNSTADNKAVEAIVLSNVRSVLENHTGLKKYVIDILMDKMEKIAQKPKP